ncbi:hypothetical protein Tco_1180695 [Tanacetum coccineum]
MYQPANDEFSQHLSNDEASNHEDTSGLLKGEYDIWAMEMEHYLEYIDNDVWRVIQNGNSKKRISTGKDGVIRILPPEHMRRFHGMGMMQKKLWEASELDLCLPALSYYGNDYDGTKPDVDTLSILIRSVYTLATPLEESFHPHNTPKSSFQSKILLTVQVWTSQECTAKGTRDGKKKRDSFYQHQEAGKQEKNQMGLLTMDDGIVNWGEHTKNEENTLRSLCSKTCIDSYNTLKRLCDEQMNQLGDQEAQILAYSQAVKKLEAQLVTFQKQQLSLNEKLTFQANEIYEKDKKLKKYRRIIMKAVKKKEQLQKTLDS